MGMVRRKFRIDPLRNTNTASLENSEKQQRTNGKHTRTHHTHSRKSIFSMLSRCLPIQFGLLFFFLRSHRSFVLSPLFDASMTSIKISLAWNMNHIFAMMNNSILKTDHWYNQLGQMGDNLFFITYSWNSTPISKQKHFSEVYYCHCDESILHQGCSLITHIILIDWFFVVCMEIDFFAVPICIHYHFTQLLNQKLLRKYEKNWVKVHLLCPTCTFNAILLCVRSEYQIVTE